MSQGIDSVAGYATAESGPVTGSQIKPVSLGKYEGKSAEALARLLLRRDAVERERKRRARLRALSLVLQR